MKNVFSTLLCLIISINANSQKKWSFGIEAFPNITSFSISNKKNISDENIDKIKDLELPKICFSGQIYASYNFNSKASLSLGVGHHSIGIKTKKIGVATTNGIINNYAKLTYSYYNIQIPLLFQHSIFRRFYARGGINTLINNYNSVEFNYVSGEKSGQKDKSEYKDLEIKNLCFSTQLSVGYAFFKNEKINLYSQITAERYFTSIIKNDYISRFPFSTGIIIGAKF